MTKLIVALDTTDIQQATQWAASVKPYAACVKLGLEFFYAHGAEGYKKIAAAGTPIFLDLKLHDIPNTVAGGMKGLAPLNPFMMTLHTSGGKTMMQTIMKSIEGQNVMMLGVTLLTSLDQTAIEQIGFNKKLESHVLRLAELAHESGLHGIVCSSLELPSIKTRFRNDLVTVVPGIRPADAQKGDQSRTMTPAEAKANGADYIVVGRPITQSANPAEAAKNIAAELA